jgi:hypothetical protein
MVCKFTNNFSRLFHMILLVEWILWFSMLCYGKYSEPSGIEPRTSRTLFYLHNIDNHNIHDCTKFNSIRYSGSARNMRSSEISKKFLTNLGHLGKGPHCYTDQSRVFIYTKKSAVYFLWCSC